MEWLSLPWLLVALILIPLGLLGIAGIVVLVLKIVAVARKAAEPPTVDQSGEYTLDQDKEVGKGPS
jgi:hypothetical protein